MMLQAFQEELYRKFAALFSPAVYTGAVWDTECTCAERKNGCIYHNGRWVPVCVECGSLRK